MGLESVFPSDSDFILLWVVKKIGTPGLASVQPLHSVCMVLAYRRVPIFPLSLYENFCIGGNREHGYASVRHQQLAPQPPLTRF